MKLKNKRTGEIIIGYGINRELETYDSIRKFCEEWEDYEEEKVNYIIDPIESSYISCDNYYEREELERAEELGIRFDSEEEAEKAVEKLKAWKRLKDKDIKVIGWHWVQFGKGDIEITLDNIQPNGEHFKDLDLLFGGGE